MPTTSIDGIVTRYEVVGSGPPLLMYSPGGFDATVEKWTGLGIYAKTKPIDHLSKAYTCIMFDRRETGQSGGRVERVTWTDYVRQGAGLLDHLGHAKAHVMGGCMGVSPAVAFGMTLPERTASMVLMWPVGGARYRLSSHQRFAVHLGYVHNHGLKDVIELAMSSPKSFGEDPRRGPWASVLRNDPEFAAHYERMDVERYKVLVAGMARTLFDRDTAPGAEPEDMLRCDIPTLVIPGNDASHATSAARYFHECLPKSEYWDAPVAEQTEGPTSTRLLDFLERAGKTAGL
jgi:pimeloyl-ACP methyl ester carboxylesterase